MELLELRKIVGDGKIFSVDFYKRSDGQLRRMVARTGVHKGLSGDGPAYDADKHNLLTVFDLQKRGYRMIPADAIVKLKAHGREIPLGVAG